MLQALEGKDVKDLLLNVGSGGGAAAAPTAGGAAPAAAAEETKEEEKEEGTIYPLICRRPVSQANDFIAKEESDEDMGFGLFD